MCKWCDELNTEPNDMRIEEIYISGAGYYGYYTPIIYCPKCGTILNKFKDGKVKNWYDKD